MKLGTKMAIFLAAVLLTFVGFSMIASPAVDIMKVGKAAGYEIISNWNVKAKAASHQSNLIKG